MSRRGIKIEWETRENGTLTAHCTSLDEYRAFLAMLSDTRGAVVFDPQGRAKSVQIVDAPADPAPEDFPTDVTVRVRRQSPPPHSPRWRMVLANNFMQRGIYVLVTDLNWTESSTPRCAVLSITADSQEEYEAIRALLEHPKGSELQALWSEQWYLRRRADNWSSATPYPQIVEFEVEEVPEEGRRIPVPDLPYSPDEIEAWLIPIERRSDLAQDLEAFCATFEPDIRLVYRGDRPYLTSDRFLAAPSIHEVMERADELVAILNAAASLACVVDSNYRPIVLESEAILVLEDGRELEHPSPPTGLRVTLDLGSDADNPWRVRRNEAVRRAAVKHGARPEVAQVLHLWMSRPHTWASLYVILELIERHEDATVAELGWTSNNRRDLFKHTANTSPFDVATLPRHGSSNESPPPQPMPFSMAVSFIRELIGEWLLWLENTSGNSD